MAVPNKTNTPSLGSAFKYFTQFTFYATILCGLTIGTAANAVWQLKHRHLGSDARVIVALALASVLGLFSFAMFASCFGFVLRNVTTVESHQLKGRVKMMAVRIERGSQPVAGQYNVVTYPLSKDAKDDGPSSSPMADTSGAGSFPAQQDNEKRTTKADGTGEAAADADPFKVNRAARAARRQARETLTARDLLAFRTFAIVSVPKGMNVWDLGWRRNWTSVMGTNVLDWLLPIRGSPCADHSSNESLYELNPAFRKLCADMQLPLPQDTDEQRRF